MSGIYVEVTRLGTDEASRRAVLDGLRLDVALVKLMVAGVRVGDILGAG